MALYAKDDGKQFEKPREGTHQAVCYAVWDLGMQRDNFQGKEKIQHRIMVAWELSQVITTPGEYLGKRFVVTKEYTLAFNEKANLRKDIEGWFSKKFSKEQAEEGVDVERLVGKNCLLNITVVNGYSRVGAVAKVMPEMQRMVPENNGLTIPEWIQKKIKNQVREEQAAEGGDSNFSGDHLDDGFKDLDTPAAPAGTPAAPAGMPAPDREDELPF